MCQNNIKGDFVYLDEFKDKLARNWAGSLFSLSSAQKIHSRAKEYLYRLTKSNGIRRITWGWYWVPTSYRDAWEFLARDKGFKVIIKQTAASIWNYDFIHRDVLRLAVNNRSYKRALEVFTKSMGWDFEVEFHKKIPYEYREVDGLFVETLESCVVNCLAEWSFTDAFATLYFRRKEIDFDKLRNLGRWKRVSGTNLRAWTLIKYGCKLFNEHLGRKVFDFKAIEIKQAEVKELVNEAVEKVVEFV
jgi:hypothetical protein